MRDHESKARVGQHGYNAVIFVGSKIKRCLMFLHALPFFGLGTLLAARVYSRLPACRRCRRPPGSMCVAHDHANACHIDALGPRAPTSVACPWPRGMDSVARSKEHARASDMEEKVMGLNCLAEGASEVTHHSGPWLAFFDFLLRSSSPSRSCSLCIIFFGFDLQRNTFMLGCSLIAHQETSRPARAALRPPNNSTRSDNPFLSVVSGSTCWSSNEAPPWHDKRRPSPVAGIDERSWVVHLLDLEDRRLSRMS
jgi:hypothetical protein